MAYSVIQPVAIAATNVDSYNRSCISASILENGWFVDLLTKSSTSGEAELWTATAPATANLKGCWMVYDPEVVMTADKYRGIDPDPRNYRIPAAQTFSAFKLVEGDLILMSADAFDGVIGVNTHANATDGTFIPTWGAAQSDDAISLKKIATEYFSIGTGAMDTQRFTAYLMEVMPMEYA